MGNLNKILFIVEGKKAEPNLLTKICINILDINENEIEINVNNDDELSFNDKQIEVYIKWIKDGSIYKMDKRWKYKRIC